MKLHPIGVTLAALVLSALPAAGQTATTDPAAAQLAADVRGIRQALDRLVQLLESADRRQEIDVLLKRIELRERRMAPLEGELSSARSEIEGIEDQLRALERMREQHEELLQEEIREGVDVPRSDTRRILDDITRSVAGAEERLESVRMRAQLVENDLAASRRSLEILDDLLLELVEAPNP